MAIAIALFVVACFLASSYLKILKLSKQKAVQRQNRQVSTAFANGYPPDCIDLYNRAQDLETGYSGAPVDPERAVDLYLAAANKGYPAAMYKLAQIYFEGRKRIPVDLKEARFWIVKAIERDYPGSEALYHQINRAEITGELPQQKG